jgi:hypothetical protein
MRRIALASVVLLLFTATAQAKLEIQDIKAVHGLFGPERKNLECLPGDQVFFRFMVNGVKLDADGKMDATVTVHLADADNKQLLDSKGPLQGVLALGGSSLLSDASVNFGDNIPAGDYTLTVTVKDTLSKETASFTRKLTVRPMEFGIVAPRLSYDAEGKVPASPGGLVGQVLHYRFKLIGFDTAKNSKIDAEMKVDVLDAKGKPTMPKPIVACVKQDDPDIIKKITSLNFNGNLALNRSGSFTLRLTVTDKVGNRTTKFEVPLKVTAP